MLAQVLKDSERIRCTQHIDENRVRLYQVAAELRREGIIGRLTLAEGARATG